MTTRDFSANVISASKVVPDGAFQNSAASGVWDINEALDLIKGGNWPTTGNVNPASFVDNLFQTYLYTGTGSEQTITNGIDLSNEGGLVWLKGRTDPGDGAGLPNHILFDTVRGDDKYLRTSQQFPQYGGFSSLFEFNANGFTVGNNHSINYGTGSTEYVSWTFRKAPKFFDIQTWSGDGESTRTLSHNIGGNVGMVLIKGLNETEDWQVYHRSASTRKILRLNNQGAEANLANGVDHISGSTITLSKAGNPSYSANDSGVNYIAYIFAHNDDDGGFGESGDQDIIKCGSYTGNGADNGPTINLGFEPQFIFQKRIDSTSQWNIVDTMRGLVTGGNDVRLYPNLENGDDGFDFIEVTPTGFKLASSATAYNENNGTYIYMAIRRGGMQTPTAASDVFAIDTVQSSSGTGPAFISGFVTDFIFSRQSTATQDWLTNARLVGTNRVKLNSADAESSNSAFNWDYMNGAWDPFSANPVFSAWMWKRARGFFDVVAWTGASGSLSSVKHNLGVKPDLVILKYRDISDSWYVYNSATTGVLTIDSNNATSGSTNYMASTTATDLNVSLVSNPANSPIAYLFATLAGVSKVGSFTQSGATNVACGFSGNTPSLVILKRTDSSGDWYLFDYASGIVAGNDPYNLLNSDAAQVTNADIIDPYSGGFATTSSLTNGDYIFYAIAAVS